MSVTRISDIIVPDVFKQYMLTATMEKSALYSTGVLTPDAELVSKLAGGGRTFNVPFWKDIDNTESDPATDDPVSDGTPTNITTGKDIARRQIRTKGWSSANLTRELAGDDPMKRIMSRANEYWGRQFDRIAIATCRGLYADNIANDSGDMVNDIATDSGGAIVAAERISADAVLNAAQTMGDSKQVLGLMVMHSVVHNRLAINDLIDFRPESGSEAWIPFYQGYRLVVSDQCPAIVGSNRTNYHTYLFGEGALGWAEHPLENGVAVDKDESAADGMGVEELWTRRQICIHPYGIKFTDSSVAGEFPTNTELRLAANWDRVYSERNQIPMALLITNG